MHGLCGVAEWPCNGGCRFYQVVGVDARLIGEWAWGDAMHHAYSNPRHIGQIVIAEPLMVR